MKKVKKNNLFSDFFIVLLILAIIIEIIIIPKAIDSHSMFLLNGVLGLIQMISFFAVLVGSIIEKIIKKIDLFNLILKLIFLILVYFGYYGHLIGYLRK